tara:strand:+ start:147 stop:338 length:192 start_codon:yes stop_codon:yes gene_type:complete
MKNIINYFLAVVTGFVACFIILKSEYKVNLIDQNTVELHSFETNRTWITSPDSIVYYLELDNL